PPQVERERQGAEAVTPQVLQVLLDEHAAPVVLEPATAVVAPPSAPAGAGAESSPMIDAAFRGGQTPRRRRARARHVQWNGASGGTTRSRDARAAPDRALQELDLPAANRLAIERAQSRRFLESLPYFRRELQLLDHDVWGLHYDFATVLNDAAFEERVRRGV